MDGQRRSRVEVDLVRAEPSPHGRLVGACRPVAPTTAMIRAFCCAIAVAFPTKTSLSDGIVANCDTDVFCSPP
jgi:phage gp36-like protein